MSPFASSGVPWWWRSIATSTTQARRQRMRRGAASASGTGLSPCPVPTGPVFGSSRGSLTRYEWRLMSRPAAARVGCGAWCRGGADVRIDVLPPGRSSRGLASKPSMFTRGMIVTVNSSRTDLAQAELRVSARTISTAELLTTYSSPAGWR